MAEYIGRKTNERGELQQMRIDIPTIPDKVNAFSVEFPVPPRDKANGEWNCDYQSRFSDACYALELDGWSLWNFRTPPPAHLPVLLMRPEWSKPIVANAIEFALTLRHPLGIEGYLGIYWKLTGVAKEALNG